MRYQYKCVVVVCQLLLYFVVMESFCFQRLSCIQLNMTGVIGISPIFFLVFYYSYIVFNSIEWHFPPQSGSCISYKLTFYRFSITVSSSVFISLVLRI